MEVRRNGSELEFLYKLVDGTIFYSFAAHTARKVGVDERVVNRGVEVRIDEIHSNHVHRIHLRCINCWNRVNRFDSNMMRMTNRNHTMVQAFTNKKSPGAKCCCLIYVCVNILFRFRRLASLLSAWDVKSSPYELLENCKRWCYICLKAEVWMVSIIIYRMCHYRILAQSIIVYDGRHHWDISIMDPHLVRLWWARDDNVLMSCDERRMPSRLVTSLGLIR
jgi:hypothetical protein